MSFIFTDLSKLTVLQLMSRTRRLFACSIGLFFLLTIDFSGLLFLPRETDDQIHMRDLLITLAVMELLVWVSFARAWNELKGRALIDHNNSNQSAHTTA
ncbi:MAG: hypothetical protein EOM62_20905 [Bacteroidia bacterium]|jgi:hypothetical protein|nr:hypothetical protein [Bacteroidia bacterium]